MAPVRRRASAQRRRPGVRRSADLRAAAVGDRPRHLVAEPLMVLFAMIMGDKLCDVHERVVGMRGRPEGSGPRFLRERSDRMPMFKLFRIPFPVITRLLVCLFAAAAAESP